MSIVVAMALVRRGRTLLVDAGGLPHWAHSDLDIGEDVVSPYLWSRAANRLDAIAITHAHADHMGGAAAILPTSGRGSCGWPIHRIRK
jgi:beta-lactamase superfamily II metal-dependent hydrolase